MKKKPIKRVKEFRKQWMKTVAEILNFSIKNRTNKKERNCQGEKKNNKIINK